MARKRGRRTYGGLRRGRVKTGRRRGGGRRLTRAGASIL